MSHSKLSSDWHAWWIALSEDAHAYSLITAGPLKSNLYAIFSALVAICTLFSWYASNQSSPLCIMLFHTYAPLSKLTYSPVLPLNARLP